MARLTNIPDNYPEFKDYIISKKGESYFLRKKSQRQLKREAARVKAGLDADRIPFFEWVHHYNGE